jgi:hypothetical protein
MRGARAVAALGVLVVGAAGCAGTYAGYDDGEAAGPPPAASLAGAEGALQGLPAGASAAAGGEASAREGAFALRINCGAEEAYTDSTGRRWEADRPFTDGGWGYVGGRAVRRDERPVADTTDAPVYLNERYKQSAYRVSVPNGRYTVRLHFAETFSRVTGPGMRVFGVSVEGRPVWPTLDPFREAGGRAYAAVVKTTQADVADGELTIEFKESDKHAPMVNGLEVLAAER